MYERGPARKTLEEACDAQTREDISMSWRARHNTSATSSLLPKTSYLAGLGEGGEALHV